MASRLDRLFVLLETGSTPATRKAASQQLGQVQRLHPHELPTLLSRVHKCLKSTNWETRIAAGTAVEAILSQVPLWSPTSVKVEDENSPLDSLDNLKIDKLTFDNFDINRLFSSEANYLMASEAKVFDNPTAGNGAPVDCIDPIEQRNLINKRLGLDLAEKIGIDTSDMFSNEDLVLVKDEEVKEEIEPPVSAKAEKSNKNKFNFVHSSSFDESLSSREINLAKRRARKQKSREVLDAQSGEGSQKKVKKEADYQISFEKDKEMGEVAENVWPLSAWVDILVNDLFSPMWEIRHGSATALREVIRLHGKGGGRTAGSPHQEIEHQIWLEDISLRFVSVLALDRFGDFVSDQVIAPVRETCSQCLGILFTLLSNEKIFKLLDIFLMLLEQKSWEVRHGSLLALKYLFATRIDLVNQLLPMAFSSLFTSLSDSMDDVCAVAASALIPVVDKVVEIFPGEAPKVVNVLWDSLANLDDLSSSCNSIMSLLAKLLTFPPARSNLRGLDVLMPRLWPFLHHTSSSVRKSTLMTLQKLTELDPSVAPLSAEPLQETLKHSFQRALVEHNKDVLHLIPEVWSDILKNSRLDMLLLAACPLFSTWLCLAMQPPRVPIDPSFLVPIRAHTDKKQKICLGANDMPLQKIYMSGSGDGDPLRVAETRLILSKMLGMMAPYIVQPLQQGIIGEEPIDLFCRILLTYLNSRSALQRSVTSLVISAWPNSKDAVKSAGDQIGLTTRLIECLNENVYFDEIALAFTRLQSECRDFLATLKHYKVPMIKEFEGNVGNGALLTFEQVRLLSGEPVIDLIQKNVKKTKTLDTLLERRKTIWNLWLLTTSEFAALNTMTLAALSGAVCSLQTLPDKLNPIVKPLMESIKKEENQLFQKNSAQALCLLMDLVLHKTPCPIPKIIQNLSNFLCSDGDFTPPIDNEKGILSLTMFTTEAAAPPSKRMTKAEEAAEYEQKKGPLIQRRGATFALISIVKYFGADLPTKVEKLWELTFGTISGDLRSDASLRNVIDALQILEIISPEFDPKLFPQIDSQISRICILLDHKVRAVRHMASRCLAVWTSLMPSKVMPAIGKEIVPMLDSPDSTLMRQGAMEAIWCIVDKLGLNLLPYIVLLVVPVLGRMSDQDESVRLLASLTFATLVRLMPLEGGVPDPPDLPEELAIQKGMQREFLDQLLNPTKIPEYTITIPIKAELRPYQQAGVNWIGFLNKYKLHGTLCDDMGLGKTLMSICVLGSDHYNSSQKFKNEGKNVKSKDGILPSIVICPPTLTGHWVYEIEKFVSRDYLNPLHYHGPPVERNKLKAKVSKHNMVVASYDIVRNDIDFFSTIHWNYCILDEGHIIKNGKTKISRAIKQLQAHHRLILSGTPIQNNVLELWSLFDFLMPGFLGTEKQFSARFARPILLARDPKSSPKDQEGGALAMESLHRQALPFLLRRLKEDVLQDLPPKITQDYYCELSPIQEQIYEDFARTRAHQSLRDNFSSVDDSTKHSHIFQALQYLRKVCNHPKLVLTPQHPKYATIMSNLSKDKSSLNDIHHSAKLPALKQLLLDCGIGASVSNDYAPESIDVVNQHRALIFCQLKVMLDILEKDLFKVHMPTVTYLRLDGGVPAGQRHSLVTRFNNDPSIDVLLLTTQVGGLGLNLTGADTVIFVEHDWNPMRDLQAMDRAHRIGQKKVVNVYRLITRGTLEEKIMGLQKFKLMTANTIIGQENSCIETMATDQLLDLFVLEDNKDEKSSDKEDLGIVGAYKNVLENMPELWEDKLYEEEYDLSSFIKNLAK